MPQDSETSPSAVSADLTTELVGMLATVLRLKDERIDAEQTFQALGLDSLLTVEFVATVNARYGTSVKPDALFDHPTLLELARHVARERGMPGTAPFDRPVSRAVERRAARVPAQAPAPAAPSASSVAEVLGVLREELARILCCDPWDIDTAAAFNVLGVDSILGAEFVATINDIYGLRERAVTLYDHPNLASMAAHVASVTPAGAAAAAPVTVTDTAPAARVMGLDALLDAVRDDRISVDDALGLLPQRF
ncbi:acyl carrier protein [Streptomyces sp. ALI-76-A]|jgi:acyl carrier protein|uniref:acyl carrier protein n=1 Tax=Streptomyces sp. ALI-76-A TaxID=3025736 RepID=UPI00256F316A|nr:acyl carrier protein [Streptomyces sp. ALI-76-A]MDL5205384.1 acyl carrier protein [Streptomyces sp. ALI-76-A]